MSEGPSTQERKTLLKPGDEDAILFEPLQRIGWRFWAVAAILLLIIIFGVLAYYRQVTQGLGITGLNYPVYWGMYIINTIFFIAISYGGTLTSAILRIFGVRWRTPITRAAEVMTACTLSVGAVNIVLDMGRPDRVLHLILYGRYQSPILWDFYAISLYMVCSLLYLYLPLIPDIAELKERFPRRRWFYGPLSLRWTGTPQQKKRLERIIDIMAVAMVPIAVMVHTVLSYLLSLTTQPMWHSTLMGPYFVMGAIYSGMAGLVIVMALLRRFRHLERYLKPKHFNYMGLMILGMTAVWLYFTFSEYITTYYGQEPSHMEVFYAKFFGEFAPYFWTQVGLCLLVPVLLLSWRRTRTIVGTVVASGLILVGMWLERLLIIIPTLTRPRLPADLPFTIGTYRPTSTEWAIMAASAAAIALLYLIFIKLFPIVPVWEIRQEREQEQARFEQPPEPVNDAASSSPLLAR